MKKHKVAFLSLAVSSVLFSFVNFSDLSARTNSCDLETIKKSILSSGFPGNILSTRSVTYGSVNLCEVIFDMNGRKEVGYTTPDGNYLIFGTVIDLRTRKAITMERREELNKVVFSKEQWKVLKQLVDVEYGNGTKNIYIFTDPHCPYCQRLESSLKKLADEGLVKVHIIIFPVHAEARNVASAFICMKGSGKDYIEHNLEKYNKPCDEGNKKLEKNMRFAQELRITGTPSWILDDGVVRVGAIPEQELRKLLTNQK